MYLAKFCVSIYLSYLFQILHGRLEISRKFVKSPAKKFILKVNDKSTKIDILRVNNKDTRKTSRTLFQSLYCLLGECFTHCPVVSTVDFEYANAPCLLCSVVLVPLLLALTRYLLLFFRSNKHSRTTTMDAFQVSLILTWNRLFPTHPAFPCSKSTKETAEQWVRSLQS